MRLSLPETCKPVTKLYPRQTLTKMPSSPPSRAPGLLRSALIPVAVQGRFRVCGRTGVSGRVVQTLGFAGLLGSLALAFSFCGSLLSLAGRRLAALAFGALIV